MIIYFDVFSWEMSVFGLFGFFSIFVFVFYIFGFVLWGGLFGWFVVLCFVDGFWCGCRIGWFCFIFEFVWWFVCIVEWGVLGGLEDDVVCVNELCLFLGVNGCGLWIMISNMGVWIKDLKYFMGGCCLF